MIELDLITLPTIAATTTPTGRFYHTPIGDLPSITTVLSSMNKTVIEKWRQRVGKEVADKITNSASVFGTSIHDMCEEYIRNDTYTAASPLHMESFLQIKRILDQNLQKVIGLELPLYSKYLGIAGRLDCIGLWNNKLCVIDFKTSNKYKNLSWITSYYLQATAYCLMFEELTGKSISSFVILISSQEGTIQIIEDKRDSYILPLVNQIEEYYNEKALKHPCPKLFTTFT